MFDEIALKKNLAYDAAHDVVHGSTDDGTERSSTIADRAMVVLLAASHMKNSAAHTTVIVLLQSGQLANYKIM